MEQQTKEYVQEMFRIIDEQGTTDPRPSYLSVTTITSTFKIDSVIDVQDLKQKMNKNPFIIKKKGGAIAYTWNIKDNKFFNQITAEYTDEFSKKSIKFFPNGSIHVTGCSDLVDCHRVMNQVKFCIKHYTEKDVSVYDFNIQMINANFTMNHMLNLATVSSTAEKIGCTVSFKPEIYSAVKLKFVPGPNMKKITASVFSSGCVLITGAKTLAEITASYKFLIHMLRSSCIRPNVTSKKFKKFMGIPFAVWEKKVC